eukprot:TRINITY_DN62108_c0_g1_i1.p1 TRINITY_DN62108_c0_g1~~TRINITY_DN62108_c0_g1_i1.p1  ORF type:complete len:386 (-),score=71.53 TRINITY_DN62108_c0_g1_i1:45-1202(-)
MTRRVSLTSSPVKTCVPQPSGRAGSSRPIKAAALPVARGVPEDAAAYLRASPPRDSKLPAGGAEILPVRCPGNAFTVSVFQSIGDRRTQEDRFTVVPCLDSDIQLPNAFFGVFDGTVGDFASDNVKDLVVPKLLESPHWKAHRQAWPSLTAAEQELLLSDAVRDMYRMSDDALLARCAKYTQHYATCTSVTAVVMGDLLVIGHLGDSRIILVKEDESSRQMIGEQLTEDHKPDTESERKRIEQCGGMVERLQNHGNKPFIRGGDFMMRKALGEQPMQLQYSRAFGAKDLKIFGLSNVPDVRTIRMGLAPYQKVRCIILASDGLWDVLSAQQAAHLYQDAMDEGQNVSRRLVEYALTEQARVKARADNITAMCIQFDCCDAAPNPN